MPVIGVCHTALPRCCSLSVRLRKSIQSAKKVWFWPMTLGARRSVFGQFNHRSELAASAQPFPQLSRSPLVEVLRKCCRRDECGVNTVPLTSANSAKRSILCIHRPQRQSNLYPIKLYRQQFGKLQIKLVARPGNQINILKILNNFEPPQGGFSASRALGSHWGPRRMRIKLDEFGLLQ